MKSFNNDPKLKADLIALLDHHQRADAFLQGTWLTDEKVEGNGFRGCFYGCTMQTKENPIGAFSEKYHVDLWYCYLTERIFEGLPDGLYQSFPKRSIEVIPVGFDNWGMLKSKFFQGLLMDPERGQIKYAGDNEEVKKAIMQCASLFDSDFDEIPAASAAASAWSAASAAASAWSAAAAARSVAESAASAARSAESAASASASAWSAARSAASAAWSAESAWSAWSAASAAHYQWMADMLFELFNEIE